VFVGVGVAVYVSVGVGVTVFVGVKVGDGVEVKVVVAVWVAVGGSGVSVGGTGVFVGATVLLAVCSAVPDEHADKIPTTIINALISTTIVFIFTIFSSDKYSNPDNSIAILRKPGLIGK
jgi:hypothetical protein